LDVFSLFALIFASDRFDWEQFVRPVSVESCKNKNQKYTCLFGVYNTTNDSGSDTCSEKAEKSHETDEAASSQEESAHLFVAVYFSVLCFSGQNDHLSIFHLFIV
jgi:hypothetical protein